MCTRYWQYRPCQWFTYQVAQAAVTPNAGAIHVNCRTQKWFAGGANVAPNKAAFCCQDARAEPPLLIFYDTANTPVVQTQSTTVSPPAPANGNFDNINTLAAIAVDEQLNYVAYALISHGPNSRGAYAWGVAARQPLSGTATLDVTLNNNDNARVWDLQQIVPPGRLIRIRDDSDTVATGYDDIVRWKTQSDVIRGMGSNSCAAP